MHGISASKHAFTAHLLSTDRLISHRLLRLLRSHQNRARLGKLCAILLSWTAVSRHTCRLVRQKKVLCERLLRKNLREHYVAWEENVGRQMDARRIVAQFYHRKCYLRCLRAWVERRAALQKQKRHKLAAARIRCLAYRRLKSSALQVWNGTVNDDRVRMKLCRFFDQKREHALKMDCFHSWLYYQRKEKDLLRRVQYEAEVSDRKLQADVEMCERMMQRYSWRRYERQICMAFIGWHVYCVNQKHQQMVDHIFFKKFSDETKKKYFTRWAQTRRFARLYCGFLSRSRWRRMNNIFLSWRRNFRHEERAFCLWERTFGFKRRIKLRMALQRWLHVAVASVPLLRAKLGHVKDGRWYSSLLLRVCMQSWEEYVRLRIRLIHSFTRIKCYHFRYWRTSMQWQRRGQRIDKLIERFVKKVSITVKSLVLSKWKAARSRNTRLRKAQRLWSRSMLSKAHKLWKSQVAFERLSGQARTRYRRRCLEKSSVRVLKAWRQDAVFEKLSRSVSTRSSRKLKGHLLLSALSKWRTQTISDRISRQVALRSERRAKQSLLRRAIAGWHDRWLFLRVYRHSRRRARCRLKRACMRTWEACMFRSRHFVLLDGLAAGHNLTGKRRKRLKFVAAWRHFANVRRSFSVTTVRFLTRQQQRLRLQIFRTWWSRREYVGHVKKMARLIVVNAVQVREVFSVWHMYVRDYMHRSSVWADYAALRAHTRKANNCFRCWCDLTKAHQMQNAVNSLISHTAEFYPIQGAHSFCIESASGDNGITIWTVFFTCHS